MPQAVETFPGTKPFVKLSLSAITYGEKDDAAARVQALQEFTTCRLMLGLSEVQQEPKKQGNSNSIKTDMGLSSHLLISLSQS